MGRAPATALAYMYWYRGFTLEDAFEKLRVVRPCNPRLQVTPPPFQLQLTYIEMSQVADITSAWNIGAEVIIAFSMYAVPLERGTGVSSGLP